MHRRPLPKERIPIKLAALHKALEERERRLPRPKLVDGTELIGEYEGSGFKEPQYIARRHDGKVLQLPHLLWVAAAASDGKRDLRDIAGVLSDDLHRPVSVDNVHFIVEEKLRPLGVLETERGEAPELEPHEPLLALKLKQAIVPPNVVGIAAKIFKPLFFPIVVGAVLALVGVLDVWIFFHHGVAGGVREILYNPALLVALLGLLALSALFHEIGHATACRYGGATPGAMGAGLYIVWPAFYTDVTDAYRLNRLGRLRTDLGGVYFNLVFVLAVAGIYFWTGFEPLLTLIVLQHVEILHQFVPWIRLDGYYVVSDLTGVPDVMSRIKPTLLSLVPGRGTHPRVAQLKPWVRGVVTLYVLTVVPILIVFTALMIIGAPHVFATAASSAKLQAARLTAAFGDRDVLDVIVGGVQLLALSLPPIGLVLTLLKIARTTTSHVTRRLEPRPRLRNGVVFATGAAAALFAFNWWSNHPFVPIAQGDRGTVQAAAHAMTRRPAPPPPSKRRPDRVTPTRSGKAVHPRKPRHKTAATTPTERTPAATGAATGTAAGTTSVQTPTTNKTTATTPSGGTNNGGGTWSPPSPTTTSGSPPATTTTPSSPPATTTTPPPTTTTTPSNEVSP